MLRTPPLARLLALTFVLIASTTACDEKEAPAPPKPEPTAARATERSRARWACVEKADWVAAYEFMAPEAKRDRPLPAFLANTQHHRYERMHVIEVVALEGEKVYLRIGGLWTPLHPETLRVKLEPGQTLTQDIELIETWRWTGSEWFYLRPDRPDEFFERNPALLRQPEAPAATTTTPPPAK